MKYILNIKGIGCFIKMRYTTNILDTILQNKIVHIVDIIFLIVDIISHIVPRYYFTDLNASEQNQRLR